MDDQIELFRTEDAQMLLRNKYVLFIGDSVIRAMYKDMIKILQTSDLLKEQQLKTKGEFYFENDELLEGGQKGIMSNDTTYTEIRQFCKEKHLVKFYFITRCYSDYLMSICDDLRRDSVKPDVVIMNSGCWDLTRYGANSRTDYRRNLPMGIYSLLQVLPISTLFIWTTTLPLSKEVRGGFMIPEVECMQSTLRHDVLDANYYASLIMKDFNVDLVDMHYYFKNLIKHRKPDGIHWDVVAHRRVTNILLSHIGECWAFKIPFQDEFKKRVEFDAENFVEDEYTDFYDDYPTAPNDNEYNMNINMNEAMMPPIMHHQGAGGGGGGGGGMMMQPYQSFQNGWQNNMPPPPMPAYNSAPPMQGGRMDGLMPLPPQFMGPMMPMMNEAQRDTFQNGLNMFAHMQIMAAAQRMGNGRSHPPMHHQHQQQQPPHLMSFADRTNQKY